MRESNTLSEVARARMLSLPREPLFLADWLNVVMVHLEVEPRALQPVVPFELDLRDGHAFVTLVAFTLRGMHPRFGGRVGRWLFQPLATHQFLNVRTYVQQDGEAGIHFLGEWLDSPLAVQLGPRVFALPYHLGRIEYQNQPGRKDVFGRVTDAATGATLVYRADQEFDASDYQPCAVGSLDEWLMERYSAFNSATGRRKFFRVWHEPWPQVPAKAELCENSLLTQHWPFFRDATVAGCNLSPGLHDVWLGWPHKLRKLAPSANATPLIPSQFVCETGG